MNACFFTLEPPGEEREEDGLGGMLVEGGAGGESNNTGGDPVGADGGSSPGGMTGEGGVVQEGCFAGAVFLDDFEEGDDCWRPNFNTFALVEDGFEGSTGYAQEESKSEIRIAVSDGPRDGWEDVRLEARFKLLDWGTQSPSSDDMAAIFVRYQDPNNYYALAIRGDNRLFARKRVAASSESLGQSYIVEPGWELGRWYTVALEVEGSTLRTYLDGELRRTIEDSSLPGAGQVGIGTLQFATVVFDDVVVTSL